MDLPHTTMMFETMLAIDHIHIELSSICTLACPRCPRAELSDTLLNKQLSLSFFKTQIGDDVIKNTKKITLCGNDGDPIYCKEFLEICKWIKNTNPNLSLVIITNGSYKKLDWWVALGESLNHRDELHLSLDGWDQKSNSIYRINSNWESIITGFKTFRKTNQSSYCVWDAIAFRFNESNLDHMKNMAKDLNFDEFQLTKSTKFGSKYPVYGLSSDYLEPVNKNLISSSFRYEREITKLSNKTKPSDEIKKIFFKRHLDLKKSNLYSGICLIGNKGIFINSQGHFFPCCWVANRYDHNKNWIELANDKFNLYTRSFKEIIEDSFWHTDFLKFESFECQTKCTKEKLEDTKHSVEW